MLENTILLNNSKINRKRIRNQKYRRKIQRLYSNSRKYPSPVVYIDEVWIKGRGYVKNPKPYYKRLYRSHKSKYLKRQSSKKIRRYKGELHNGWSCHRIYDFWWEYC